MNKLIIFVSCILFNLSTFSYAREVGEGELNDAKENVINSHVHYTKLSIDKKCQKLKKKIGDLYRDLYEYEMNFYDTSNYSENPEFLMKRKKELSKKIKKYEDKIDNLKLINSSLDRFNFNSF